MVNLNALKKAPILDQDGAQLQAPAVGIVSSDPAVVAVTTPGYKWHAVGIAAGTATLTATRSLDGAVSTLAVTVVAAVPFSIALGPESPA